MTVPPICRFWTVSNHSAAAAHMFSEISKIKSTAFADQMTGGPKKVDSLYQAARDSRIFAKGVFFHSKIKLSSSSFSVNIFSCKWKKVTMVPNVQKPMKMIT